MAAFIPYLNFNGNTVITFYGSMTKCVGNYKDCKFND